MYASRILGADKVCEQIRVDIDSARSDEIAAFARESGVATAEQFVHGILSGFLHGTGIPCSTKFDQVLNIDCENRFEASEFENAGTRSRLFVWAATGQPYLPVDDDRLRVWHLLTNFRLKLQRLTNPL